MNTDIENFLSSQTYSDATKATYRYVLTRLVNQSFQNWHTSDLLRFIQQPTWGNSMQYVALCACKKYIAWIHGENHPATNTRLKRIKPKKGRSLDLKEILELTSSFDPFTPIGARDLALAALAIDTGLRSSELARLQLRDVDLSRCYLQVIVKGGDWSFAIYCPETAAFIDRWLGYRKPADGVGNLFISLRANKTNGSALTNHGMKCIFRKWGLSLGWKLSPHDARRTLGNVAAALGASTSAIMAAGRWNDYESFRRYQLEITAEAIRPFSPIANALKLKAQS